MKAEKLLVNNKGWGASVVEQLARDLHGEYPGMSGFSRTNLFAMRQFYLFFLSEFKKVPQSVGLLPWGHIRVLLSKVKDISVSCFCVLMMKNTKVYL